MHKVRNNELAESVTSMFSISNNPNYNLRSNKINFDLPRPKTNFSKKSISYSGPMLWNSLPKHAKDRDISSGQFKNILNDHFTY